MEENWEEGLCREFVEAVKGSIYVNSKSAYLDYSEIGKEIVALYREFFSENHK